MGSGRQERYGRGRGALLSGIREAGKVREGEGGTAEWAQGGRQGRGGALLSGLREAGKVREGEGGTAEWAQGGRKGTGGGGGHC